MAASAGRVSTFPFARTGAERPAVGSSSWILLDVAGCAHLLGGEAALARDLVTRLTQQGLRARVAVADTVGCAWGIARYGKPGIIPRGETKAAVLPLPIAALRVEAETVADL